MINFQNLAAEKTYNNLDVTLKEANEHRNEWFEGVHTCKRDDSLFAVMETIVKAEVHRLVIIDGEEKVCGLVSLSDILSFLVLRPSGIYFLLYDFGFCNYFLCLVISICQLSKPKSTV